MPSPRTPSSGRRPISRWPSQALRVPILDPDGKPLGRVHIAAARRGGNTLHQMADSGCQKPEVILKRTMGEALELLRQAGGSGTQRHSGGSHQE